MTALVAQAAAIAGLLAWAAVHRPHALKYGAAHSSTVEPVKHHGADERWHPAWDIAAPAPAAVVAGDHRPDLDEQLLLADFDALIESWRVDPPWLTEWREHVDDAYAWAGMDTEAHHRWRYGVLDVPTGEYRLVPTPEGGLR